LNVPRRKTAVRSMRQHVIARTIGDKGVAALLMKIDRQQPNDCFEQKQNR
jgi:hypothetical protein